MNLSEAKHPESVPEVNRRRFAESVERINPEDFDQNFHEIAGKFRNYLKGLLHKMQSIKNEETIMLTEADREIINRILEEDTKVKNMEDLLQQFEDAHETFGTTELQKDIDVNHRAIVSIMAVLDRMLKGDKDTWKVIQTEDGDLGNFIFGMLAIWLSEHNEDLLLGH